MNFETFDFTESLFSKMIFKLLFVLHIFYFNFLREINFDSFFFCRSYHRHSPKAKDPRRRVRIHRYWNEDFLVAVQFSQRQFNDLFVWKWMECQNPKFLYNFDLFELYPQGLFPTAFFLWKHYLVLMPDTGYVRENQVFTSMIRVHDLNDNMKLVGSYDFPEQSSTRRYVLMWTLRPYIPII